MNAGFIINKTFTSPKLILHLALVSADMRILSSCNGCCLTKLARKKKFKQFLERDISTAQ